MRVLLTGGGTGGHVNPALAIGATILRNDPNSVIAYVGTPHGIENKLVPPTGYHLYHVNIRGLKRSLSPSNIKTLFMTVDSVRAARKILREFKPDIVIGTGGYVCFPIVRAASLMKIPTALHESNAVPGVAVKMLAPFVDRIYLNFEETSRYLSKYKDKLLRVGNPLISAFSPKDPGEAKKKLALPENTEKVLLTYGGSMGAERVNDAVLDLMKVYTSRHPEVYHIHAAGSIEYEIMKGQMEEAGLDKCPNIDFREYIYNMPEVMAAADLIICRAGAMTVSELAMSGKAAVFVPSPNVTNNHQYKNAKVLCDADAAEIVEECSIDSGSLNGIVEKLMSKEGDTIREGMGERIRKFAVRDANLLILRDILRLVK